ncbi:MAG: diguanylate cyclase [Acidimicrobiales bacterium]
MKTRARRFVVGGLLAVQLATVILILLVSGRLTSDAEADHTVALLQTSALEALDHTRDYLAPASSLVATTADVIDGGAVDIAGLERAFLGELERSPQLSGVYLGGDDGTFFFVSRVADGYRVKTIDIDDDGRRTVTVRDRGPDGVEGPTEVLADDTFDPRTRPWFQNAARGGSTDVSWTAPYVFFTSQELGVTASAAVQTDDGMLVVVGADIELGSLSTLLAGLRIGPTGSAVIVDQADTVIAHPDATLVQAGAGDASETVSASELDDPRARAVIGSMISAGTELDRASTRFETDEASGVVASRTLPVGDQQWTIAVHAEDGALVRDLTDARRDERRLMMVVGLLGFVLLAVVAFPATRPLARLERRAKLDTLTGLLNRGAILAEGAQIAKEADLHAAIMIDLDRFKAINDTHGHQVGDEVIHEVGQRIAGALRGSDRAGRVGGEEFLVVIGETTPAKALEVAHRVHRAIGESPIGSTVGPLEVTASVGLGVAVGPAELQRTLAVADTALLEAKESGRDCVVSGGMASDLREPHRSAEGAEVGDA